MSDTQPRARRRSFQCYDCGRTVEDTEVRRRNILTYGTSGRYIRTNSRRVNLCEACFDERDVKDRRNTYITLIVVAVLAIAALFYFAPFYFGVIRR